MKDCVFNSQNGLDLGSQGKKKNLDGQKIFVMWNLVILTVWHYVIIFIREFF